ncbi:MAG TPA: energy transducer TonB [Longimicrobium sp.]|jgi:hypothetical protein
MSPTRRLPILVVLLAAAGLAGCASRGQPGRSPLLLSERPAPSQRACRAAPTPEQLPEAAELVDAQTFSAEAARLWESAGRPAGYVLFSMRYDTAGTNVRRAVIEHDVTPELADTLQKLVFAHRRQAASAREEWGVRLRVDLGQAPVLRVGRREECRPVPTDYEYRVAAGGFDVRSSAASPLSSATPVDPGLVWVRVWLDEGGVVTDARVERSLYRGNWEALLLNQVRAMQFAPALDDGFPVASQTSIPMRVPVASGRRW